MNGFGSMSVQSGDLFLEPVFDHFERYEGNGNPAVEVRW